MPRISAPTVAEHRIVQRAALLSAVKEILLSSGADAVTARSAAERAGLARSSFYEYFPSRDEAIVAVAIEAFREWGAEIEQALQEVEPAEKLGAYITTNLMMAADGKHRIASILQKIELTPERHEDIIALHDTLVGPLIQIVRELDSSRPVIDISLVRGLLNAGMQLVEQGSDADEVATRIREVLHRGMT